MEGAFGGVFRGVPVLVTGHTGFKGSWLSIWLAELGAEVVGYSLDPPSVPSNFEATRLAQRVAGIRGDVRSLEGVTAAIEQFKPRVVFHLAAQAIVRTSYEEPHETFDVNVGGTVTLLEAVRRTGSVKAVVCVTSDKCYENREWLWGYREIDRLGGRDPYSASKAMAELAIASYRQSFFPVERYEEHGVAVASVRAGNVIGGGDWARDRLVADCMRALMAGEKVQVRNPHAARPWQLVLEPLSGYLWLAAKLLREGAAFAEAWNFGPSEQVAVRAGELVRELIALWGAGDWEDASSGQALREAGILRLSCEKAAHRLGWRPAYTWREAAATTVDWFKAYRDRGVGGDMYAMCVEQIGRYVDAARGQGVAWAL